MTKEVIVSISGLQFAEDGTNEPVEVITAGDYYNKNGKHYIVYDEVMEGFEGTTKNRIKLDKNLLDITKKGIANVHMLFEKDKKNLTYYSTPFGNLLIGIDAKQIEIKEEEHDIDVLVDYALEVNYEHLADCKIHMNIKSKEVGDFRISG
jgi:uncharacterized beta-barrel protein YwiB (DUF1934 family)